MLELSAEQVAALTEIDANCFVERVRENLVKEEPKLAEDQSLSSRLARAFSAARRLGINTDDNLVAFLRIEAYAPRFYEKPATHAWLTRLGASPDARFHDYMRVLRWRYEQPERIGGMIYGGTHRALSRARGNGAWLRLCAYWHRLVRRRGGGWNS